MHFRSEAAIDHFLSSFETGSLPRYCWTHAAHLAMCAARLWQEDETTIDRLRREIQHYNHTRGTPPSAYHETLTRFWMNTVRECLKSQQPESRLAAVCGTIKTLGLESGLPRKRYTFDVFQSTEARERWIPPDRE